MKLINRLLTIAACFVCLSNVSCNPQPINIQILCTSDIHGMLVPFDYAIDESTITKGSLSQAGTIINNLRNDNTLVIDCGDIIQGNYADIFVEKDKDTTHPMIEALNLLKYDVFVTGNHEYNFGVDYLKKQLSKFKGTPLTGNVFKKDSYEPLADAYKIFNKGGVRVAVIGMTTHLITRWDHEKLEDYIVTDAINETKKTVKMIKDNNLADVIVAAEHLGLPKENDEPGTSCRDLANACPDIDVILGAHEHKAYEETVNNVLVVENAANAQSLMQINLEVSKKNNKYKVTNKKSKKYNVGAYKTNSTIDEFAKPFDAKAKENARTVIGKLNGDKENDKQWMRPLFDIKSVPSTYMQPTPLTQIINDVQLEVAKAKCEDIKSDIKVASTAVGNYTANLKPGNIKKCDCSNIYKYVNTLYVIKMNGKQLKQYMEWTTRFFKKFNSTGDNKDLTVTFVDNSEFPLFNYDMFTGVDYEINIDKDVGSRIENLKWTGGNTITEDEEFYMAINNYRANTHLLSHGPIYKEGDKLPTLYKSDLDQGKGIREMLVDYISSRKVEGINASDFSNNNWKIKHTQWDTYDSEYQTAVNKINNKELSVGERNTITITQSMIK